MQAEEALHYVRPLADGFDPITGEVLSETNPCQHPQVVRALYCAIAALQQQEKRDIKRAELPEAAGNPWTKEEEQLLVKNFGLNLPVGAIAKKHKRTRGAIESRLIRLGLIENRWHNNGNSSTTPSQSKSTQQQGYMDLVREINQPD
ncbi:MAG: hypothetical protein H6815_03760 [Phycisphaeraceae bacterium]|nr:hypothetical protein [Phycisphaerales bacterium]MCB9859545.1 hypothetical protein [Phycisphaeraceae bacterium]